MEIPTQAKTIPMNPDEVKVRPQVCLIKSLKESDATLQLEMTSPSTLCRASPCEHTASASASQHEKTRRQGSEKAYTY